MFIKNTRFLWICSTANAKKWQDLENKINQSYKSLILLIGHIKFSLLCEELRQRVCYSRHTIAWKGRSTAGTKSISPDGTQKKVVGKEIKKLLHQRTFLKKQKADDNSRTWLRIVSVIKTKYFISGQIKHFQKIEVLLPHVFYFIFFNLVCALKYLYLPFLST